MMKIALVQLKLSTKIEENLEKHYNYIKKLDSDLIAFPECSLCGYDFDFFYRFKDDKFLRMKYSKLLKEFMSQIIKRKKNVIFGSVIFDKQTQKLFNCGIVIHHKKIYCYKKISLTEYEKNLFSQGKDIFVFEIKQYKIGIIICRDQSNMLLFQNLRERNVNLILILSAHYYMPKICLEKRLKNIALPITRAYDFGVAIAKVNAVGVCGNLISHGNSLVVKHNGSLFRMLNEFDEDVLEFTMEELI